MFAYVYIPIVQREIDLFVELWNNSRHRLQRNTLMPDGIPNVIHNCPEEYGMEDKGWPLTNDEDFQRECATHLDDVLETKPSRHYTRLGINPNTIKCN